MSESKGSDNLDKQYFKLVEAVGSKGKYQTALIILSCVLYFQNGFPSLGTPYYFASAPYTNCPPQYAGITKCTQYACSFPVDQRAQFQQPQIRQLKTLGNQFGDYHCGASDILETAKGVYYFGGIVGVLFGGPLADNFGRRLALLSCISLGVLGHIIVQLAGNLIVVQIGMFLVGVSVQSCFNHVICILSEVLENEQRQKKTIMVNTFFCIAGIMAVISFYALKNWRPIFISLLLIPMVIALVFTFFFVQQTPQFLIKRYKVKDIRKSLRFMAKINGKLQGFDESDVLSQQNLTKMKQDYKDQIQRSDKKAFTYLDLFKFRSLRRITVLLTILFILSNIMYYAPAMLIDQFGFDFYLNGLIIFISELITYFVGYCTIKKLKRKRINIIGSSVALACSFVLVFLHRKQICTENCWNARIVFELIMVFVMRFFVSFIYQVFYIYITELYPTQVVGLGIGFTATAGALPVMFIPELINVINRSNFPVMVLFCIVSGLELIASFFLEQTYGRAPPERSRKLLIQKCLSIAPEIHRYKSSSSRKEKLPDTVQSLSPQ